MIQSVPKLNSVEQLQVAVVAANASRLAQLQTTVTGVGHRLVRAPDADVVLVDGGSAVADKPSVVLGAHDRAAAGWLPAEATPQQIDAALRAVAAGLLVRGVAEARGGFEEMPDRTARVLLTPRELEVLDGIGAGLGNKAIARQLGISLHTVKFHIESLFRKLGARTRAEAVAKGLERRVGETVEL